MMRRARSENLHYYKHLGVSFSSDIFYHPIHHYLNTLAVSIFHFHWIGGNFIPIESFPLLNKPIVWTLHDMWAFTGGCHYDNNCGRYVENCGACPLLRSSDPFDISY